ncbi:MAG: head-tail connector protein [Bacillota bacterium]|nr:head-tail connector protein [Bacillota bacterium]
MELPELKEWLRITWDNEDTNILQPLMSASEMIIEQATGVKSDNLTDEKAKSLYNLIQKIVITDLYENRAGGNKDNPGLTSLYMQLESYKLGTENIAPEGGDTP